MNAISKAEKRKRVEKAAKLRTALPCAASVSLYEPPKSPHTLPDLVINRPDDEADAAQALMNMHRSPTISFTPICAPDPRNEDRNDSQEVANILKTVRTLNNRQKITHIIPSLAVKEPRVRFVNLPGKELKPMDLRVRFSSIGTKAGNEALAAEYTMASPRSILYIKAPYGLPPVGNFAPPPVITRTGRTSGILSSTGGVVSMPLPADNTASKTLEIIQAEKAVENLYIQYREKGDFGDDTLIAHDDGNEYNRQCDEILRLVGEVKVDAERISEQLGKITKDVRVIFGSN